ncbi:MAG: translation initiation factor eIF-2B [Nanoarchaeota archaeon]|nr:translation initiation factor eIF-2B [Nanoarchaeota archaeon]
MVIKKKPTFSQVTKDIKDIKIQGARNIAGWALYAYLLKPKKKSIKILKGLRPTEPMLTNVLNRLEKGEDSNKILDHFTDAQNEINKFVLKEIKKGDVIFTHCHSTNVVKALINAKKKGKKFEVYNTETRPLFQGRKTASELRKAGIPVTMFVDSAMNVALSRDSGTKKVSKVFIGSDALVKEGIINKIGSEMLAILAKKYKIPFYVVADSWKFSNKKVPIENRKLNEVWDKAPKNIKIKNPSFEFVPKEYIKGIISELGNLSYNKFLKVVKKS